jgi:uncharacterized protein YgfB (UPF0149 family)
MMQVTFREIATVLERAGSQVLPAEGHGCLCGALCTTPDYTVERWLDELVTVDELEGEAAQIGPLKALFAETQNALRGDQMEFQLLLPDDDEPLERRVTALAQWCQGFLYGFGTGKPVRKEVLKGKIDEILRDLTHISRATVDVGAADEEEEASYTELVEYLRVGVQLIHDELAPFRQSDGSDAAQNKDSDESAGPEDRIH